MKHIDEIRVYYADTDAYGVVWHGAYLRWLEAGRIEFTDKVMGLDLKQMQADGCILPVVELNIKYKISAKLDDNLILETYIEELRPSAIVFKQVLKNKDTGIINITATVTCVAVDTNTNKMFRRLPSFIIDAYEKNLSAV
ncbi:MAG: acyl-CoA thioesterase [Clostridium sp.]|nr:acyl-CoA thioesterase [Clostridium sp.]